MEQRFDPRSVKALLLSGWFLDRIFWLDIIIPGSLGQPVYGPVSAAGFNSLVSKALRQVGMERASFAS